MDIFYKAKFKYKNVYFSICKFDEIMTGDNIMFIVKK